MMRRTVLVVPVAAMLLATGPTPRTIAITRRHKGTLPNPGLFFIRPDRRQLGSAQFDRLAGLIGERLIGQGFLAAESELAAELRVHIRYGLDTPRGAGGTELLAGTVLTHWLHLEILDLRNRQNGRPRTVYRAHASADAEEREAVGLLPLVVEALLAGARADGTAAGTAPAPTNGRRPRAAADTVLFRLTGAP